MSTTTAPRKPPRKTIGQRLFEELGDRAFNYITGREAWIVSRRFGLDGQTPHTRDEVAELLGVSNNRVRLFETRAIRKVRRRFAEQAPTES